MSRDRYMSSSSCELFATHGEGLKSTSARDGSGSPDKEGDLGIDVVNLLALMRERMAGATEYGASFPDDVSEGVSASSSELSRSVMIIPVCTELVGICAGREQAAGLTVFLRFIGRCAAHANFGYGSAAF